MLNYLKNYIKYFKITQVYAKHKSVKIQTMIIILYDRVGVTEHHNTCNIRAFSNWTEEKWRRARRGPPPAGRESRLATASSLAGERCQRSCLDHA